MSAYDERPWLSLYPPGLPADLVPEYPDALAAWDATVARVPTAPCIRAFEHTLSFADVDADSEALAAALVAGGLQPGERVALYLQNDPQWMVVLLAVWKARGIAVSLNPMFKARELRYHLDDSGAVVLVCLQELYESVVRNIIDETSVRRVLTTHPADWLGSSPVPPQVAQMIGPRRPAEGSEDLRAVVDEHRGARLPRAGLGPDAVAVLTYTSGTTGPAKGAMNTHGNWVHNAQLYRDWFQLGASDVVLGVAPLFHITGLIAHLGVTQLAGVPLVLAHRFDPQVTLMLVERWRATFTIASITVFIALLDHPDLAHADLSSLTKAGSGGAPISPAVVERFESAAGVYIANVYGLTETTSPSHATPPGRRAPVHDLTGALSVGVPVCGAVVRVVDLETGEELPPGQVGELVTEGPMVVPGYWNKPEETASTFPGGRLRTGDVGLMDAQGWFYLVDRAKDQINAAGYKVWPREVEDVLYQHPAVREAAVVGVPDAYRGETVKAYVALAAGSVASEQELIAFCRERLAAYKYPRQVEILEELPKTTTGKFLRRELRGRAS